VIGRLALRSLTAHPVRSAVLAAGFGAGVGVMAILLGVAEIVLQQAQSPALVGGGDVLIRLGPQVPARLALSGTLQSDALRPRIRSASPYATADLYLVAKDGRRSRVAARGGIPSLERAIEDPETASVESWRDSPADEAWTHETPERLLKGIDRFHPIPDAPRWSNSWAEWLYFNGRTGDSRFYLTFIVGPRLANGRRGAGVRLQLERNGVMSTFSDAAELSDADIASAPDLTIGASSVRLEGLTYRIDLDLKGPAGRASGTLRLEATPGRLVPPLEIIGSQGWMTGYVVPVMSGRLNGTLDVSGTPVSLDNGTGYHDHNWGFWQGVSWQWGQVQQGELSLLYGRVFPPPEAADPDQLPGFVGVLGPDGPIAYTTDVRIEETNDASGRPRRIDISARGPALDVTASFDVQTTTTTRMAQGPLANQIDFLQMRGQYNVTGRAGSRRLEFVGPGAAETFRGR
jgi:hypothetical protein